MTCNFHEALSFFCAHGKGAFKQWIKGREIGKHTGMYAVPEADEYPCFVKYVNDRENPNRGMYQKTKNPQEVKK